MNHILRNILAVLLGIFIGGTVNMLIINNSGLLIAPPEGVDMTTPEGLQEGMHLLENKHFLIPFLAHALGTFVGAYLAALIAASHKIKFAIAIGCVFLLGGIAAAFMIPAPLWFIVTDVVLAYIPMAWLAGRFAIKSTT